MKQPEDRDSRAERGLLASPLQAQAQGGASIMESPDKEVLKGMLLDRWMEDLHEDRAPSVLPEMQQLSQHEIAETLALARWLAGMSAPSPTPTEVESVAATVCARIRREEEQEGQALAEAAEQATSFGGLLLTTRRIRQLRSTDIEQTLSLPTGMLDNLEKGVLPPHRIAVDRMVALLRSLHVASIGVVDLLREAGFEWANRVYNQPATQFGRIDSQLSTDSRHALLSEATAMGDHRAELIEELERIERYCQSLTAQLR